MKTVNVNGKAVRVLNNQKVLVANGVEHVTDMAKKVLVVNGFEVIANSYNKVVVRGGVEVIV
jgi:hypothetical protein